MKKAGLNGLLSSTYFILGNIVVSTILISIFGGGGFIPGLLLVLITIWSANWDWSYVGLKRLSQSGFMQATLFTILIYLADLIFVTPLAEYFGGQPTDLNQLSYLKGDLLNLILTFSFMWIVAAFGEEFFFRGYIVKHVARLLGDTNMAWYAGLLVSSSIFGLSHLYQGTSGVISTGIIGLLIGIVFYRTRNLFVCVMIHGMIDMIGLTLIYADKADILNKWVNDNVYLFLK